MGRRKDDSISISASTSSDSVSSYGDARSGYSGSSASGSDTSASASSSSSSSSSMSAPSRVTLPPPEAKSCGSGAIPYLPGLAPDFRRARVDRVVVVVNPFSGKGRAKKMLEKAKAVFEQRNIALQVYQTKGPADATRFVRDFDGELPCVVACGGDGTIHEVVNGILARTAAGRNDPLLGIIPGGTGNSLAVDLGLTTAELAAEIIAGGNVTPMDVGEAVHSQDRRRTYFINLVMASIGVDANLTAEKLRWMGPLRYDVGAFINILKFRKYPCRLTVDGELHEGDFSLIDIQNNQYAGSNMRFAPAAQLNDGRLDLVFGERTSGRMRLLKLLGMLGKGTHAIQREVSYVQFQHELVLETDTPRPLVIDGENVGTTPLRITVVPRAIQLIANPDRANQVPRKQ